MDPLACPDLALADGQDAVPTASADVGGGGDNSAATATTR